MKNPPVMDATTRRRRAALFLDWCAGAVAGR